MSSAGATDLFGWDRLRHGGLLLDPPRLRTIAARTSDKPLPFHLEKELRRQVTQVQDRTLKPGDFVAFVLQEVCGFTAGIGTWHRGSAVSADWTRTGIGGEAIKPRHLWKGDFGAMLPVFIDTESRLGIGRGTKAASQTLQWLRAGRERLAVLTNGRQWRLVFAGLDFDAWCQWDIDLWFEEGAVAPQVAALRTLLQPALWTPEKAGVTPLLLQAILDSRKGQAELSAVLGERVREAVEILVQAHGDVLKRDCADVDPADIYRAAVRIVMRLVVVLFAESREKLLPRDNAFYHGAYGLTGLREELDKVAARAGSRLKRSAQAWPRVLALFRLIHDGSHHPDLPVPEYGGELFESGSAASADGLTRALAVFETACFEDELLPDSGVHTMLELLTRTKVRIKQGKANVWAPVPVDFSDLSSEYIGILYEGLLDFELKTAPSGDPVIFLNVGNQPALPLSRLEAMDDKAVASLLEKMKDTSSSDAGESEDGADGADEADAGDEEVGDELEDEGDDAEPAEAASDDTEAPADDERFITRTRAEEWARRAVAVGKLVRKPVGTLTATKRQEWDDKVSRKAKQIVARVVLPGEWYLVRWGGTRKGSGTFYTRPGLAVPTVHRTLRPLAYLPPTGDDGQPDLDAPGVGWTPRIPEEILAIKVCDPACGSGTFPVAALRFLTDALYTSLHHHGRISEDGDRAIVRLLDRGAAAEAEDLLGTEKLRSRPTDGLFEPQLKAVLRRHVVERCIYGVDLDPLAVELCRLSLWIETMDRDLPFSFLDHKVKCGNSLVGAWFDTFQHYPVMAWKNREGGDKGHTNGVHFQKEARTKAIRAFVRDTLTPDLRAFLRGRTLFHEDLQERALRAHASQLAVLSRLHDLPVHAASERARLYREEVQGSPDCQALKRAMNLWCACWFWPVEEIGYAPLPTTQAIPPKETVKVAEDVARHKRFFHWELEFPDVFNTQRSGFDAVVGNPPWENLQPNPEEFFSNHDPLFRTYGRLVKSSVIQGMFSAGADLERAWLDYSADFVSFAHWVATAANPFGDPNESADTEEATGGHGTQAAWFRARRRASVLSQRQHPYRYQLGRIFTYKLFLEVSHALLRDGGRLGEIVPSGLYSDSWSQPLRELFLNRCRWEWLFGFENRDKIFQIDSRFKFNPVILEKDGETRAIRTAFMRRRIEDWESAESVLVWYSRLQLERFSPRSKVFAEIQSTRDLEILGTIHSNAVLLGDRSVTGWEAEYRLEFMMNVNVHLFPPRRTWESDGYRPDEYSRWIRGDWRPIDELWRELAVNSSMVVSLEPRREHRIAEADVQPTDWRLRCAQPPYDKLPVPRASLPPGIILSRDGESWIRTSDASGVAYPMFQGAMIWVGRPMAARFGLVAGKREAWLPQTPSDTSVTSKYLIAAGALDQNAKVVFRDIARATDARTVIPTVLPDWPCGNTLGVLESSAPDALAASLGSLVLDWAVRQRLSGTHLNWFVMDELPVLPPRTSDSLARLSRLTNLVGVQTACRALALKGEASDGLKTWREHWALTAAETMRCQVIIDAIAAASYGLEAEAFRHILRDCDLPAPFGDPKGFWRVDKDRDPELRHTVLTLVAFADLEDKIREEGGDREKGIEAFLNQNDGEGWMLPERLRLADYGLGHDERAKHPQPVASRLGPRFYDWQLAQTAEESWRECELHAKNLAVTVSSESPAEAPPSLGSVGQVDSCSLPIWHACDNRLCFN